MYMKIVAKIKWWLKLNKFIHRIHKDLRRTVDLCQKAESAGVSWISVHGRTSEERHQPVHYDAIKIIKDSVSVPVIANGDVKYLRDVQSTYQLTGVDGKLIELIPIICKTVVLYNFPLLFSLSSRGDGC